jgi:DNA invertase Pin-like site-specific DNA recombinase
VLERIQIIHSKNAQFLSLDLPVSHDISVSKIIFAILAYLAEYEYYRRNTKIQEGIATARAANKYRGRKSVLTEAKKK